MNTQEKLDWTGEWTYYAAICRSKRVQSGGRTETRHGEKFWVTSTEWGLSTTRFQETPPQGVAIWADKESLAKELDGWEGHPWWCRVLDYEVVELVAITKTVFSHFERRKTETD